MKTSNLALRLEFEEEFAEGAEAQTSPEAGALERRGTERRAQLRKSFDYRAIVIRDPGLRLFRVG